MPEQVLLQNRQPDRPATLDEYRKSGGYQALTQAIGKYSPQDVAGLIDDSGLRGRGGAGVRTSIKWRGVPEHAPFPRYVVVNADEMEPGTFKDRVLLHTDPHMVIEGTILAGYAISAQKGVMFIRPSYELEAEILERELEVARQAGYLGNNILGSQFSFDIKVHRSGGRYICGESAGQVHAIQGERPHPLRWGGHMTEEGLWRLPTLVNNVETLACAPHIVRNGPEWFRGLAASKSGAGTKLYCVSGKVREPGCFDLPMGTRLRDIIEGSAGGMLPGLELKAFLPGGASTVLLPKEFYDIQMDFDLFKEAGYRLGTGAVVVFDDQTCLVGATLNLIKFFARESCGWCTPCREGLPYVRDLLCRIENGEGKEEFITMLHQMAGQMPNAYCDFAPGAVGPLTGLLRYFEDEIREHISQRKCPYEGR
jgi:NADH-quinone oxidoreductase subunit F